MNVCLPLQDPDPSIRLRAIDLIFQLVSKNSARAIVAELLNYLVVAPADQKRTLCSKLLQASVLQCRDYRLSVYVCVCVRSRT